MDKYWKYALIVLPSLLVGLALIFPGILLEGIVGPVAAVLWAAWRVIISVDQSVYWGALIVLYSLVMVRLLPRGQSGPSNPGDHRRHEPRTQVEHWRGLIENAALGEEQHAALRDSLKTLLASTVGQRERSSAAELERELKSNQIALPPAAREYLFPASTRHRRHFGSHAVDPFSWTRRWLHRWTNKGRGSEYRTLDELLGWMESSMEIKDDKG
jgi:hypothetical protein